MSATVCPESPKYGYEFDGQEMDVRRARKSHECVGARRSRGSDLRGKHADGCSVVIEPGDVYVAVIGEMFVFDTSTCLPCALAFDVVKPVP